MKYCVTIIFLLAIFPGCNNQKTRTTEKATSSDSNSSVTDTLRRTTPVGDKDTGVLVLTDKILTLLKNKNYLQFADHIHPVSGIRFSPYGYVDTTGDVKINSKKFLEMLAKKNKINWGSYDGTGDKMLLSVDQYFKKFVYNADFLNAEKKSLNKIIGVGNSLNNLETVYKDCDFSESYFSGFDKKYDGMDWCSLKLVFKKFRDKTYLVAIIHDQWTT